MQQDLHSARAIFISSFLLQKSFKECLSVPKLWIYFLGGNSKSTISWWVKLKTYRARKKGVKTNTSNPEAHSKHWLFFFFPFFHTNWWSQCRNKTSSNIDPWILNIDFSIMTDPRSRKQISFERAYLILWTSIVPSGANQSVAHHHHRPHHPQSYHCHRHNGANDWRQLAGEECDWC